MGRFGIFVVFVFVGLPPAEEAEQNMNYATVSTARSRPLMARSSHEDGSCGCCGHGRAPREFSSPLYGSPTTGTSAAQSFDDASTLPVAGGHQYHRPEVRRLDTTVLLAQTTANASYSSLPSTSASPPSTQQQPFSPAEPLAELNPYGAAVNGLGPRADSSTSSSVPRSPQRLTFEAVRYDHGLRRQGRDGSMLSEFHEEGELDGDAPLLRLATGGDSSHYRRRQQLYGGGLNDSRLPAAPSSFTASAKLMGLNLHPRNASEKYHSRWGATATLREEQRRTAWETAVSGRRGNSTFSALSSEEMDLYRRQVAARSVEDVLMKGEQHFNLQRVRDEILSDEERGRQIIIDASTAQRQAQLKHLHHMTRTLFGEKEEAERRQVIRQYEQRISSGGDIHKRWIDIRHGVQQEGFRRSKFLICAVEEAGRLDILQDEEMANFTLSLQFETALLGTHKNVLKKLSRTIGNAKRENEAFLENTQTLRSNSTSMRSLNSTIGTMGTIGTSTFTMPSWMNDLPPDVSPFLPQPSSLSIDLLAATNNDMGSFSFTTNNVDALNFSSSFSKFEDFMSPTHAPAPLSGSLREYDRSDRLDPLPSSSTD